MSGIDDMPDGVFDQMNHDVAKQTEPHVYVSTGTEHHFCDRCLLAEDDDRADHVDPEPVIDTTDDDPIVLCGYDGKTIREVIDDYVLVRGDLVDRDDPHAREQLASIVEGRIQRAVTDRVKAIAAAIRAEKSRTDYGIAAEAYDRAATIAEETR